MEPDKKNANLLSFENKEVVFIKPSKSTPTIVLSLSSIDNDNMDFYAHCLYIYRSLSENQNFLTDADSNTGNTASNAVTKRDPAKVITEAISKTLFYYYPLAGKLVKHADGKLRVHCTSDGVPFQEVICNCNLSTLHYLDRDDVEIAKHFGTDFPFEDEHGNQHPVIFKLTKFLCGGFICAWNINHAIIDGIGMTQFLVTVAEFAGGQSEPSVKPVWERERLVGKITRQPLPNPMDNVCVAVSPLMPTKDYSHACFRIDKESIARLKTSLMKDIEQSGASLKKGFTTFECLAAYIWRARARALKLNDDGETMLLIIVGVRPRLEDPLPTGYYGNSIVDLYIKLTVKELNQQPLFQVVKHIREGLIISSSNYYITNYRDTLETKPLNFDHKSGAITPLTDWRNLGSFEKIDFGWKEAVNMMPVPGDVGIGEMYDILPPSKLDPSMNRGVRFFTSIPTTAMPKFKEEMEVLTSNDPKLKF
ncbi:hypothetical protein VNO78_11536 [Psophocarpus tetragonolobus]|uniref:Uncharacterized protein n=1 Tax=Psophocarpus tetragonolobus TaxID=3891 RepID=A0AAN9XNS5_PSOTE